MTLDLQLVRLGLRRAAPPLVLAAGAVLGAVLVRAGWGESPSLRVAADEPGQASALVRGLGRQGIVAGFALFFVPWWILRAARWGRDFRGEEASWIAPRVLGPRGARLSAWLGLWCAGALVLAAAGLAAELATGGARRPGQRQVPAAQQDPRPVVLAEGQGPVTRVLSRAAPPGATVTLRLLTAPGSGPGTDLRLTLRRAGVETEAAGLRVAGATRVELPCPGPSASGGGARGVLELVLERAGPGAVVVLRAEDVRILAPCASESLASMELTLRLWLALGAWLALGFGLGRHVGAPIALAGLTALWGLAWWRLGAPAWLPGADLGTAFTAVGQGVVPAFVDPRQGLGLLACLGLGLEPGGRRRPR